MPAYRDKGIFMKIPVAAIAAVCLLVSGPVLADEAQARARNCMNCHKIDGKFIGPAYKEVAARYAGQAGAVDKLAEKIQQGSEGVWGRIPMAPNPEVSADEAKKLVIWVLSLK
jgi:cytochrome c